MSNEPGKVTVHVLEYYVPDMRPNAPGALSYEQFILYPDAGDTVTLDGLDGDRFVRQGAKFFWPRKKYVFRADRYITRDRLKTDPEPAPTT